MLRLLPLLCLACATPLTPGYTEFLNDFPEARSLLDTSSSTGRLLWQTVSGNLAKSTTPLYTVDGSAEFTQSFFTGSNAKYTIWVRGDDIKAGDNIEVGLDTDCEGLTTGATGADYMVSVLEL